MSYYVAFAVEGREGVVDGDEVGSARGWYEFGSWVERLGDDYPVLSFLVEEGGVGSAEDIGRLEQELAQALSERPGKPSEDVIEVGRRLLAEVKGRPPGAEELAITDGTAGGDDEDEEE